MTIHDEEQTQASHSGNDLYTAVLDCQKSYWAWAEAVDKQQQLGKRLVHEKATEHLLIVLKSDLRKLIHKWVNSGLGEDEESLILNAFTHIYLALPKLQIDPQKNLRGYLIRIAQNGLADRYREDTGTRRFKRKFDTSQSSGVEATDTDHHNLYMQDGEPKICRLELLLYELYAVKDNEDVWVNQMNIEACLYKVSSFWCQTLSKEDRTIIEMRWTRDPRASFEEIARALGSGWTVNTVCAHHSRVIKKTRLFLRSQGWHDGELDN